MDVEDLINRLTLEEKVELTAGVGWWHTATIERLSIPPIRLSDGPNGVRGTHFFDSTPSACLPCGTALGASWNIDLIYRLGQLLSDEAHAKGAHVLLGPTVNIQRGPLGGRGFESFSEDPILSGVLAGHYVRGMQKSGVSATMKHFACNDMESARMAVDIQVTERALREVYLLPFMIAVEMANPRVFMTAYNKVNGKHAPENDHLLQDILRDEWKWDGLVVSDWFGTYSTSEAINAGQDLEMPGPSRWRGGALIHAVTSNKVKLSTLDERVRKVLKLVKHSLENTSIPPNAPEAQLNTQEHIRLLREAAAESVVLLKNEKNILPLDPKKRVAVIGPNADISTYCGGGSAGLRAYHTVSPLDGIKGIATNVAFSKGAYGHRSLPQIGNLLRTADGKRQGFSLRIYNEPTPQSGSDTRRVIEERHLDDSNIWFVDYEHPELAKLWYAEIEGVLTPERSGEWDFGLSVHGTGELFIDGQLVISNVTDQRPGSAFLGCGTVEEIGTMKLEAGKRYNVLVRWGCDQTSNLKVSGVVDFGQGGIRLGGCPRLEQASALNEAVELAKSVDQVVLCVGTSGEWESEGQDRTNMSLPPGSDELIAAVLAANPNTVVLVQSGTPISMPWIYQASTLVQAWFGGNEAGNGIADVLFGVVNPAGKLPITMPRRVADNPSALNFRSEGGRVLYGEDVHVGYRWYDTLDIEPLFPFGHGLSYTTFSLSDLTLVDDSASELVVRVKVTNTGSWAGAAVVQAYVQSPAATPLSAPALDTITRSTKELKCFTKVYLEPGANSLAELKVDLLRATSYWNERESCWCSDAGEYKMLPQTPVITAPHSPGSSQVISPPRETRRISPQKPHLCIMTNPESTTPPRQDADASGFSDRSKARELASRACDACRARRRKCVFPREGGTPASQCMGCSKLHIQCSFAIPTRPRGPKRKRTQAPTAISPDFHSDSPSDYSRLDERPSHDEVSGISDNLQLGLESDTQHSVTPPSRPTISGPVLLITEDEGGIIGYYDRPLPTDELCPRDLFLLIMTDYIERIYPLVPIVHLPTFRADLAKNRDVDDRDFLSLIVSLAALTIGLLPSRFDNYHAVVSRFGSRTAVISYIVQMCQRLRHADYWDHVSHKKWAAAYALSVGVFQTGQTNQSRMFEAEAMQIARLLEIHRISGYEGLNAVETQLRKKAFWLQFYTFVHSKVQPGRGNHVTYLDNYILREVDFDALEPLNILDEHVLETGVVSPAPTAVPVTPLPASASTADDFNITTTFIISSRAFLKGMREAMFNDGCDCGYGRTPAERLSRLQDLLHELRYMLDGLPHYMRQWGPGDNYQSSGKSPYDGHVIRHDDFRESNLAHAQNEITRVNLHVSHLWLQSFLLDKMDAVLQEMEGARMQTTGGSTTSTHLKLNWREREDVCRQLIHILHSIPHAYLEPNGLFLIYKVRDVASSLLNCPFMMDEQLSRRASELHVLGMSSSFWIKILYFGNNKFGAVWLLATKITRVMTLVGPPVRQKAEANDTFRIILNFFSHMLDTTTTTTITSTTTMEAPVAPPSAPAAALLECHICDLSFKTAEEKRQHAKSEWHVYKIRCRVAEPGTTITPPDNGSRPSTRRSKQEWESTSKSPQSEEESYDEESESDSSSDKAIVEFIPEECLFCNRTSSDFEENLAHMHQAHSLIIPFQSSLAVDLQTLVWFLHMVIFSYRECICCGRRRRTTEAVQQHMTSMGHCRFNVTEEMSELYDLDSLGQQTVGGRSHPDDRTFRLPSGKLLAHRSYVDPTPKSRVQEKSPAGQSALPTSQQSTTGTQALTKKDRREQALTAHFSQLSTSDQMSLVHLPESQQRSLLLAHKKELDSVKRAERRKRRRLDNVGNKIAIHTNYYKQEVPIYSGG
ncbi:hypothetical protein FDECE_8661 [Fusarium decemcellulare]|nr:hypothetical protein FDECE_8661 [Fusarium decemcellulare]